MTRPPSNLFVRTSEAVFEGSISSRIEGGSASRTRFLRQAARVRLQSKALIGADHRQYGSRIAVEPFDYWEAGSPMGIDARGYHQQDESWKHRFTSEVGASCAHSSLRTRPCKGAGFRRAEATA